MLGLVRWEAMQCAGKAKYNFCPYTRYEGVWESEVIAPIILNLSTVWRGVVRLTPRPFYIQERAHKYPFYRMYGLQARFGCFEGGKILLGRRFRNRVRSACLAALQTV